MFHRMGQLFLRWSVRIILHLLYRIKFVGEKQLPKEGAYILCPNHRSIIDIPISGTYSKSRWIYFMGKKELFEKPFSRFWMNVMDVFPVDRGKGDIGSIKKALGYLKNGQVFLIFPQGTREKDGEVLPAQKGVALLAAKSEAPIIPMYITGTIKPFRKITVYVGKPFDLGLRRGVKYSRETYEKKSQEVMTHIKSLAEVYNSEN
ncbi:MAG: 1-acyl-sn-glycerol-3-phosphate acyltransferase [Clostridiales bacterium]|nr:1-acyl-sn-glycerol-3-phosphate acyltransferase [Clostridiales bacterium]